MMQHSVSNRAISCGNMAESRSDTGDPHANEAIIETSMRNVSVDDKKDCSIVFVVFNTCNTVYLL